MNKKKMAVAIVGGGASGVIAACQLIDRFRDEIDITIYDPSPDLGGGVAYGAQDVALILNVPFTRMNYDPTKLHDFENYLKRSHPEALIAPEFPYVSRSNYREYLQARFKERRALGHLTHRREIVETIQPNKNIAGELVLISVGDNNQRESLSYSHVFVATGYQSKMPFCDNKNSSIISCFDEAAIKKIPDHSSILIAGMGLSAIDSLRLLREKKNLRITVVSRRGQWPIAHRRSPQELSENWEGLNPRQVLQKARSLRLKGSEWADIADSFRVEVAEHWQNWSPREKKNFINHLRPLWELVRHRLPPDVGDTLSDDLKAGRITNVRGDVKGMTATPTGVQVLLRRRGDSVAQKEPYDFVIVAMGARVNDNFLSLVTQGLGGPDVEKHLHFVGPASKIFHWEITAIPEIAEQIAQEVGAINIP